MLIEQGKLGTATFSDCSKYRYTLDRPLESYTDAIGRVSFLMLNPSTASADKNDPTVAKCCRYALAAGATELTVINIFAYRSTDPEALKTAEDPIGQGNDQYILDVVSQSTMTICAWGKHGDILNRGRALTKMLLDNGLGERLYYLHLNGDGSPGHPLYLPLANVPQKWAAAKDYANATGNKKRTTKSRSPISP